MDNMSSNLVPVGRISGVFGVKGWVKIHSNTEPRDNIFKYAPWWIKTREGLKTIEIDEAKPHGKGLLAHIKGVDDRDVAAAYTLVDILVDQTLLPELDTGEYYWHQLEGLKVITEFEGTEQVLGVVSRMLETGANDVLVVNGDSANGSLDDKERLLPYVPGQFVKEIDLDAGTIRVDWDPEF